MARSIPSLGESEVRVPTMVWQKQPCTGQQMVEFIQQQRPVVRTTVLDGLFARRKPACNAHNAQRDCALEQLTGLESSLKREEVGQ